MSFDTVLQHWKDAEGNFTELLFLKGRRKGEVRLCTNTAVKGLRRLTCNIWGVRSYAPEDLGTYVVDDRSFPCALGREAPSVRSVLPLWQQQEPVRNAPWMYES